MKSPRRRLQALVGSPFLIVPIDSVSSGDDNLTLALNIKVRVLIYSKGDIENCCPGFRVRHTADARDFAVGGKKRPEADVTVKF